MFTVSANALVAVRLGRLRDAATPSAEFRRLTGEIGWFLAYEAARSLPLVEHTVTGPLGPAPAARLAGPRPLVVPILRAGLGLSEGVAAALGEVDVAPVGIRRDEATLLPDVYCSTLPDHLRDRPVFVCDPMLATGGSAAAAVDLLRERHAGPVVMLCLVAAPEGIEALARRAPDVTVVCGALDDRLNERGYILPGLGDAGDRLFGVRDS